MDPKLTKKFNSRRIKFSTFIATTSLICFFWGIHTISFPVSRLYLSRRATLIPVPEEE